LQRIATGDRPALKLLYDDNAMKLLGLAVRILGDRQDAEDVVQDVFVTIWHKAAEYDPARASGEAWLVAITRNRAIDRLRARGRAPHVSDAVLAEHADHGAVTDAGADAADTARTVGRALAGLDPRHAAVIRAVYFDGLGYEELSRREGLPVGTIKTWVFRGLRRMREGVER
jgi:RNA polymerase sigma-70 factor (ECF subfamily)